MVEFFGSGLIAVVVESVVVAVIAEVGGALGVAAEVELPVFLIQLCSGRGRGGGGCVNPVVGLAAECGGGECEPEGEQGERAD